MVAFPLFGGTKIWFNHASLDQPDTLERYGVYYEEIQTNTRSQAMFNVFAMIRRLVMILTITQIE